MAEVSRRLGKPFMPWQSYVADVALEIDPDTGRLAYDEVRITVPRQSGKSTWVLAKAVHRCSATDFFGPRQKLVYTAQTRLKAREKWEEDYAAELEVAASWRNKIAVHKANGNEHIRFANKSRFGIESNTEKAGHGSTLDEAYIDEAFAQVDGRLEQAFSPAMITRPNKQLVIVSTAGWLDASPYLWSKVSHGREVVEGDKPTRVAYFEWSAAQDADPFDRAVWWECMPALGYTITEDAIAAELERMMSSPEGLNGFRRAYLNQWVPKSAEADTVLPGWPALEDPESRIVGPKVFAVDRTPDLLWTTVAVAGSRKDGKTHVGTVRHDRGSGWVVDECKTLHRDPGGVFVVDPKGPAGPLIPDLRAAGCQVIEVTADDYVQACSDFVDAVNDGHVRHLGQEELDQAVSGARPKASGDRFKWDRKRGSVISPLVAATLAMWRVRTRPSVYESRDLVVI